MLQHNEEKFNEIILMLFENLLGRTKRMAIAKLIEEFNLGNKSYISRILKVSRTTIRKALLEFKTGIIQEDKFYNRGRKPTTVNLPNLEKDIKSIVNSQSQTDPTFKSTRLYTRLTVREIRNQLITSGYNDTELPSNETLRKIINSLGFTLRKVGKTKPLKKIPETDLIFENLNKVHQIADSDENTVRISIDAKDKVKIGEFSRGGYSRILTNTLDHDFSNTSITPFGILDTKTSNVDIIFTESKVTADFIVDCIEKFWLNNYYKTQKDRIVINMDNGPENNSRRSQFMKRITEFSVNYNVKVILAYYPPYHSKYNLVERVWGILENHWNGSILDSKETVMRFAQSMTYRGIHPVIYSSKKVYESGIKTCKSTMKLLEKCIDRMDNIEKWFITIEPDNIRNIM